MIRRPRSIRSVAFALVELAATASFVACGNRRPVPPEGTAEGGTSMAITVSSSAFSEGGAIPARYTADGEDVSPPLAWSSVPAGAKSLALVCDDPDAPAGTWVHWVLYDLPARVADLPEAIPPDETLANGARQGRNDFRKIGYGGPAPPSGVHRYFFKLYALDASLDLAPAATKDQLLQAMKGHVLAEGQLMGTCQRR